MDNSKAETEHSGQQALETGQGQQPLPTSPDKGNKSSKRAAVAVGGGGLGGSGAAAGAGAGGGAGQDPDDPHPPSGTGAAKASAGDIVKRAPMPQVGTGAAATGHPPRKAQLGGKEKLNFTLEEDTKIIEFVRINKTGDKTGGNKLWQEAARRQITGHSWQSMRQRWKTFLGPAQMAKFSTRSNKGSALRPTALLKRPSAEDIDTDSDSPTAEETAVKGLSPLEPLQRAAKKQKTPPRPPARAGAGRPGGPGLGPSATIAASASTTRDASKPLVASPRGSRLVANEDGGDASPRGGRWQVNGKGGDTTGPSAPVRGRRQRASSAPPLSLMAGSSAGRRAAAAAPSKRTPARVHARVCLLLCACVCMCACVSMCACTRARTHT